jgi:GWxTD domain-containing protein
MNIFRTTKEILLLIGLTVAAASVVRAPDRTLPAPYQKWLEEEVVYIITPLERDVFLKLRTDRERDLFIEAFWKHRDPAPSTPENEFKTEHYRRIQHANRFFGRETPQPGWKTDRGRIYIILGDPRDVQRFEGKSQTYPAEVWFYQDMTKFGLPPGFHLVFFQKDGVGEFTLYSPVSDGPQALLTSPFGDPLDFSGAYLKLKEIEPVLAEVSLSLVPGEESTVIGRPSLASDLLIQRVMTAPRWMVEETYARKFLEYKDIVEVEYTANYVDCDSLVKVIKDPGGLYFVHFAVEPKKLSVSQSDKSYATTLKLNGRITTPEGLPVFQMERDIHLDFDAEKLAVISRKPLNIHDMFPLIPGNYRLSVLIKNEVSKEFTSFEQVLSVSGEDGAIRLTSPILAYRVDKPEDSPDRLKPFRLGPYQVYCQPNRAFSRKETLGIVFQVDGLLPDEIGKSEMHYQFLKNGQTVHSFGRKVEDYHSFPNILEEFPLVDFEPAHYEVKASLIVNGREVAQISEEFDITPLEAVKRPWLYSKLLPPASAPVYDYIIGTQFFNIGRTDEAIPRLEKACRVSPDSADFAQSLARAYLVKAEYQRVESFLLPFFNPDKPPRYELYLLLGTAYQKEEEWNQALGIFDEAISQFGISAVLLNAVGECYFQSGDMKAALLAWEKSLEINADQPQVRQNVEIIRGKK